jgi:hypothetical protein
MAAHQSEGKTGKPSAQTAQTSANSNVCDSKGNDLFSVLEKESFDNEKKKIFRTSRCGTGTLQQR